jgi:hypothetical protein
MVYVIVSKGEKEIVFINGRPDKILESNKLRPRFSKSILGMIYKFITTVLLFLFFFLYIYDRPFSKIRS